MVASTEEQERIIITGSGGVLGTALIEVLGRDKVYALRRGDCDLIDREATLSLWQQIRPTVVYHLAGWVAGVQGNINNAGRAFYDNAQINLNVVEASRAAGVRKIVAAGTTAMYSDDVPLPMKETDIWKGVPHSSEQAYGQAKRAMLAHLESYRLQYGLEFCFMLCTNLYGKNDRFDEKYGHVVPSLISRFERAVRNNAPEIVIWGDGTPTRDFLYADDAARAFAVAGRSGSGIYNLATGRSTTIRELVDVLVQIFEYSGRIVWDTSKPSGQKKRSYDVSRVYELYRPDFTDIGGGLKATAIWYRENFQEARR